MNDQSELLQLNCPKCGSDNVVGMEHVESCVEIAGWVIEDGVLRPEWAGDSDMLWDTSRPIDEDAPFLCRSCHAPLTVEGDTLVEVVTESEPAPTNYAEAEFIEAAIAFRAAMYERTAGDIAGMVELERFDAARAALVVVENPDGKAKLDPDTYRVTWVIEVEADNPRHAAEKALDIHRDASSIATIFTVESPDGAEEAFDLSEGN